MVHVTNIIPFTLVYNIYLVTVSLSYFVQSAKSFLIYYYYYSYTVKSASFYLLFRYAVPLLLFIRASVLRYGLGSYS